MSAAKKTAALVILIALLSAAPFFLPAYASSETEGEARALPMLRQHDVSHPEHVLLAFYKTAGLRPDFHQWAAKSPFLDKAKDIDVETIVSREDRRLQRAYAEYEQEDLLVVHTRVLLDEYSTLQEILNLSEFSDKTFFTYSLYSENVAIVPNGIESFNTLPLSKDEMDGIFAKSGGSEVEAELLLKPVVADSETPFDKGGVSYWLMLAEIAEIRLWAKNNNTPRLLWFHRAGWYEPEQDRSLLDLKAGGGVQ